MKWIKIVFTINGRYCCSQFSYQSEEEKAEKLKAWKQEHKTPYNDLQLISFDDDWNDSKLDSVTSFFNKKLTEQMQRNA